MHNHSLIQMRRPWPASFFGALKSANTGKVAEICYISSDNAQYMSRNLPNRKMNEVPEDLQRQIDLYEQIGTRIKDAADRIGGLQKLAPLLTDVSRRTLSDYVSGKSEPKARTIVEIVEATGVTIQWLVSGTGPVSTQDVLKQARQTIDESILMEIQNLVSKEYGDAGIHLTVESLMRTTIEHYNAMILQAENPTDLDELRSLIPWSHRRIRRQIAAAKAEPGTGKRSAS